MQLPLFDWPLERLRRLYRAHPRRYAGRLRREMTMRLLEEICLNDPR